MATECLRVDGNVKVERSKGHGQLLFTQESIFAFRTNRALLLFGVLGYFLGSLILKAKSAPPHLEDPEIRGLESSVQKKVSGVSLLAKLSLHKLEVKRTRWGFNFSDGNVLVEYQGLMHKNKISDFLAARGVEVS